MQGWHDTAQLILQILSNSAWSGISICSLIGIPLAIHLARKSKTPTPSIAFRTIKKIPKTWLL